MENILAEEKDKATNEDETKQFPTCYGWKQKEEQVWGKNLSNQQFARKQYGLLKDLGRA